MARVDPLEETELSEELKKQFSFNEETMGFIPNSLKTMARIPGLVSAFTHLSSVILGNDILPAELRGMIALMASTGAECRYCQAHTSATTARAGVTDEKLSAIWNFESSGHFNDSERAALRFAFHSGQTPNAVTDFDTETLQKYFTDQEITSIISICSLFGYLNRWNDTMATKLEDHPKNFASDILGPQGWEPSKHS